jgi:uncharacterized protein YebE (UPF0316 family)
VAGERLTPGAIGVTIVTDTPGVAGALWARGWPATAQAGHGENGPVTVLYVAIDRRHESRLHTDLLALAPQALLSSEELRSRGARRVAAAA